MKPMLNPKTAIAMAVLVLAGTAGVAQAATAASKTPTATHSDRTMAKDAESQRAALEKSMHGLTSVAAVRDKLKSMDYTITAVNETERDYVEYEVVKGQHSYEVQIDIAEGSGKIKDIDVAPNLWRADSTKAAMEGKPYQTAKTGDFSDRRYYPAWSNEKDMLEKQLTTGMSADEYMSRLKSMGYAITAVNDREKDYVEYEIVKGKNSYEVQIDLDARTGKAKHVDVAANLWKADGTEAALKRNAS